MILLKSTEWLPFNDFASKLSSDSNHIFRISIEENYPGILADYRYVLSEYELNRASKFLHVKDRCSYLVRKYYLRRILSCFGVEAPQKIQFSRIGNKKPTLKYIQFNVSHSNAYAVIVVSSKPVGVDIEYIDDGFEFDSVLNTCFDDDEKTYVAEADTRLRFYSLWTRKEALLKVTGEGLTDNLSSVRCLEKDVFRNGEVYQLNTLYFPDRYLLSLATASQTENHKFWHICP